MLRILHLKLENLHNFPRNRKTNLKQQRRFLMKKYVCEPCGYIYDPEVGDPDNGIAPGTAFEDIPEDWVCPICYLGKEVFIEAD